MPVESVPVIIDAENLLRAFGYVEEEERLRSVQYKPSASQLLNWEEQRKRDINNLKKFKFAVADPTSQREFARQVMCHLVGWLSDTFQAPVSPRMTFAKLSDSITTLHQAALTANPLNFEHKVIEGGPNVADFYVRAEIRYHRDLDDEYKHLNSHQEALRRDQKRARIAVGGEDHEYVQVLLDLVDAAQPEDPVQFALIGPPDHPDGFEKLFTGRGIDRKTASKRRQNIHAKRLHVIYRDAVLAARRQQRERAPEKAEAVEITSGSANDAWDGAFWESLLLRNVSEKVPRAQSKPRPLFFNSVEWKLEVERSLEPFEIVGMADQVVARMADMSRRMSDNPGELNSLVPSEWTDFVFASLWAPHNILGWDDPGEPVNAGLTLAYFSRRHREFRLVASLFPAS